MTPDQISLEFALLLLRKITAAEDKYFDANESGPQEVFQAAADEFHDAIHTARCWLELMTPPCVAT
jgi:hypothetical protein